MTTIAVDTLRAWLEEQQPVTILDVRPTQTMPNGSFPAASTLMPTMRSKHMIRRRSPVWNSLQTSRW
jgi:hypothetical protein